MASAEEEEQQQTLEYRLAHGDPSAWLNWAPEYLATQSMLDAWEEPLKRRGEPGFPETFHFYTHFPYCKQSCSFCMYWHKVPQDDATYRDYAEYLIERLDRFRTRYGKITLSNAYFGGGTPTAMPVKHLKRYFSAIKATFDIRHEFTVEAHPITLSDELLQILHEGGVNRISMGIQSTDKTVLKNITRRNRSYEEIGAFVKAATAKNIAINLDLCIGLPGQNRGIIAHDLKLITEMRPSRITLYPYQSVKTLAFNPPDDLALNDLLTDTREESDINRPLDSHVRAAGYNQVSINRFQAILQKTRSETTSSREPHPVDKPNYTCFPDYPSHLLGLGPASFNHIFGHSWSREVTSLESLDVNNSSHAGTLLTHQDEALLMLLNRLGGLRRFSTSEISEEIGIDVREVYSAQLLDGINDGTLIASQERSQQHHLQLNPALSEAERTRFLSSFIPASVWDKSETSLPSRDNVEVQLLSNERKRPEKSVREAVDQWRALLNIPLAGRKFRGAWVTQVDDTSVSFGIDDRNSSPLSVYLSPRGTRQGFAESRRFVISHQNKPLSNKEKSFFGKLVEQTLKLDPPERPRPQ